jgi:peptidoglycan hydrolase CwlO-like protein
MSREHVAKMDEEKTTLQKELETASDYILELEEKVYKANKTSLELLRQLKDAEVEIETLKNYIIDLK